MHTATPARTDRLALPGATIHYEVRGDGPLVVLHGAPMDATAFEPLANELADEFTVVTSDPRGINRSSVADREADSTPDDRADDLAHLVDHLDLGRAVVVGSSGGAVSALALAQRHPESASIVVAHEPPLVELLDDREELRVAEQEMVALHVAGDRERYWQTFLDTAGIELPPGMFESMFAAPPTPRELRDERYGVQRMQLPTTAWLPDVAALVNGSTQVVPAVGADSRGQLCDRTTRALARQLGRDVVVTPGDHTGFVDDPAGFADHLRRFVAAHTPAT